MSANWRFKRLPRPLGLQGPRLVNGLSYATEHPGWSALNRPKTIVAEPDPGSARRRGWRGLRWLSRMRASAEYVPISGGFALRGRRDYRVLQSAVFSRVGMRRRGGGAIGCVNGSRPCSADSELACRRRGRRCDRGRGPPAPGDSVWQQFRWIVDDGEELRNFMPNGQRGGVFRHVNLLVPAITPGADVDFLITEPVHTPPMSRSNSMCRDSCFGDWHGGDDRTHDKARARGAERLVRCR